MKTIIKGQLQTVDVTRRLEAFGTLDSCWTDLQLGKIFFQQRIDQLIAEWGKLMYPYLIDKRRTLP